MWEDFPPFKQSSETILWTGFDFFLTENPFGTFLVTNHQHAVSLAQLPQGMERFRDMGMYQCCLWCMRSRPRDTSFLVDAVQPNSYICTLTLFTPWLFANEITDCNFDYLSGMGRTGVTDKLCW